MGLREDICRAEAAASRRSSAAAYWLTSSATKRKLWSRRCNILVAVNMSRGCIICCIKSALYTLYKRAIQAYTADAHCPARLVALCSVYSVLQRIHLYRYTSYTVYILIQHPSGLSVYVLMCKYERERGEVLEHDRCEVSHRQRGCTQFDFATKRHE